MDPNKNHAWRGLNTCLALLSGESMGAVLFVIGVGGCRHDEGVHSCVPSSLSGLSVTKGLSLMQAHWCAPQTSFSGEALDSESPLGPILSRICPDFLWDCSWVFALFWVLSPPAIIFQVLSQCHWWREEVAHRDKPSDVCGHHLLPSEI